VSFDPLPAPLLEALDRSPPGRVVELGCGDGRLARIMAGHRAWPLGMDRVRQPGVDFPFVVGDVARPPLRAGAWDVVVLANLLRHLPEAAIRAELWYSWLDLLGADGDLFILEDEPAVGPGPAWNYMRLQALLAELPGRGPLLPLVEFRRRCRRGPVRIAAAGLQANRYPLDATAVGDMLADGTPPRGSAAAKLAADIARDGIALGSYWWARIERRRIS